MADLPYASAQAGASREGEIRAILRSLGASAIGFMVDDDADSIIAQFRLSGREITIPIEIGAYARAFLREKPYSTRMRKSRSQHEADARRTAEAAAWAILRDWIKAQATMMQVGFLSADVAFLPHIHTPDGRRVYDAIAGPGGPLALPAPSEH